MSNTAVRDTKSEPRFYDILMLALSLWVMVQLALEILLALPPATLTMLSIIDGAICVMFLVDWVYFLVRAVDKPTYLKSRFIDLIASISFLSFPRPLRVLRIVRILRTFRLLRGLRGMKTIIKALAGNPARSMLFIHLSATSLIYLYCSLGMYSVERGMNPKLNGFGDARWMTFTTLVIPGAISLNEGIRY